MNTPRKTQLPIAANSRSNNNLDGFHFTTSNFMDFNLSKKFEVIPGASYNVHARSFTRLEPLSVPTFGDASLHSKAFFVPFRTIFPAWNDFITDVAHIFPDGQFAHVQNVPFINLAAFNNLFITNGTYLFKQRTILSNSYDPDTPDVRYDLIIRDSINPTTKYGIILNRKGSRFLKLLLSLGYSLNTNRSADDNTVVSALPLLALAKVYMDWYYPQAYIQDERAQIVNSYFNRDVPSLELDYTDLYNILSVIDRVNYDADYFVSAWDQPAGPNEGSFSDFHIGDITTYNDSSVNVESDNYRSTPYVDGSPFTQFADDALHAMSDYCKRHQISGARAIDRYLSRYGYTLNSDKLLRSQFLAESSAFIQFGDVTSMASTESSTLGDFAGKGVGVCDLKFEYTGDEFGMIIIVNSIVPRIGYYEGVHRENLHLTKLDFWTPEFDALGVQAISLAELYQPLNMYDASSATSLPYEDIFGFVPRYGEYKVGCDQLTGDYRLGSRNTGKDAWTLLRSMRPLMAPGTEQISFHDINFVRGSDADQYNRIFTYMDEENADFFNIQHQFRIQASLPCKGLYDNYEFKDEDKSKKVAVDVNGVKAN